MFELDTRTVETVMTTRERIVFFVLDEDEAQIRSRIAVAPLDLPRLRGRGVDRVAGYVDATDLFQRVLRSEAWGWGRDSGLVKKVLMVPDRLTLSEMLTQFREAQRRTLPWSSTSTAWWWAS